MTCRYRCHQCQDYFDDEREPFQVYQQNVLCPECHLDVIDWPPNQILRRDREHGVISLLFLRIRERILRWTGY